MTHGNIALTPPRYVREVTETFRDYFEYRGIELADEMSAPQREEVRDMLTWANRNFSLRMALFGAYATNLVYGPYGQLTNDSLQLAVGHVVGRFEGFDVMNAPNHEGTDVRCTLAMLMHGPIVPANGQAIDAAIMVPLDGFSEVVPLLPKTHLN